MHLKIRTMTVIGALALAGQAHAVPLFLGEQEIAEDHVDAVETHCQDLFDASPEGQPDPVPSFGGDDESAAPDEDLDPAVPALPLEIEDDAETEASGESGSAEGTEGEEDEAETPENAPDFALITLEDCKGAGIVL